MRKLLLIIVSVTMLLTFVSCGKQDDSEISTIGTEKTPPAQNPANNIDTPTVNSTEGTKPTDNSTDPTDKQNGKGQNEDNKTTDKTDPTDGKLDKITDGTDKGEPVNNTKPQAIKGAILNDVFSETGDQIDTVKSNDKTTYTVKYSRALSLVVEVSQKNENGKITVMANAYLNHYSIYIGKGKTVTAKLGNSSKTETLPAITHEDDSAARTKLISAEYTAAKGEIVDVEINMPYEGSYGDKYIKALSFSGSVTVQ